MNLNLAVNILCFIMQKKTGNILGERYAWIKFTIYDKEKQEAGEFVYGNLRV